MKWNEQEETQLKKLFGTVTIVDVATNFVAYSEAEEVAIKVYDADTVYRDLNVKTQNEFIAMLEEDSQYSQKQIENAWNYASGYTQKYLQGLSIEEQIDFTLEHNGLEETDIVDSFLEYMVSTKKYQNTLGLLELKDCIDIDHANYIFDIIASGQDLTVDKLANF